MRDGREKERGIREGREKDQILGFIGIIYSLTHTFMYLNPKESLARGGPAHSANTGF
jgi:hypothetical protein